MKQEIWNFWSNKYHKLWVQKFSLKPTRNYILNHIKENYNIDENIEKIKVLDLGCGPGELIEELQNNFKSFHITGVDFSEGMLNVSKTRNPKAKHIHLDVKDLNKLKDRFNIIICTHSLPYYKEPEKTMKELNRLLIDDGKIYMGFASGNNLYDKFVLSFVKLTTGPANYPSDDKFKQLINPYFKIEKLKIIKEKSFMPRIAVYTLKKVKI